MLKNRLSCRSSCAKTLYPILRNHQPSIQAIYNHFLIFWSPKYNKYSYFSYEIKALDKLCLTRNVSTTQSTHIANRQLNVELFHRILKVKFWFTWLSWFALCFFVKIQFRLSTHPNPPNQRERIIVPIRRQRLFIYRPPMFECRDVWMQKTSNIGSRCSAPRVTKGRQSANK